MHVAERNMVFYSPLYVYLYKLYVIICIKYGKTHEIVHKALKKDTDCSILEIVLKSDLFLEGKTMKKMSKILALLLAVCMLMSFAACGESATGADSGTDKESSAEVTEGDSAVAKIKERGKIVMVTEAEFAPFEFKESGEIVGIDADIAEKIAEKLGVELEITDIAFDSCVPSVQGGKADFAAAGMTVTESRLKNVDFSDNYFDASQVILVGIDSDIASREDLNGKVVGVQQGTTGDVYCTNEDGDSDIDVAEVKRYNKFIDAVSDLISGRIDAVVVDDYPADKLVSKNPDKIKKLSEPLTEEAYAIAVAKESDLTPVINEVLKELKENGGLDAIIGKYIEE